MRASKFELKSGSVKFYNIILNFLRYFRSMLGDNALQEEIASGRKVFFWENTYDR